MLPSATESDAAPDERTAAWLEEVAETMERGRRGLLARQQPDGHWVGELQGDTILESEFILLLAFLGKTDDARIPLAANYLLQHQLPGGGWSNYPGGPAEISVSVKAYFALKIAGFPADEPRLRRAAEVIRGLGGAEAANSFTRFYLALLGQLPYAACPSVPAEIVLLPRWFFFNIYAMSAWSRTIFVPLSVVDAFKPVTRIAGADARPRVVSGSFRYAAMARQTDAAMVLVDELLPRHRLVFEEGGTLGLDAIAAAGGAAGRGVDSRTPRGQRRPRRDFPADGLSRHRACVASAWRTTIRRCSGCMQATRRPVHLRR